MKCLTVRQPWASLLVSGVKRVENRSRRTHHRGLLAIHAGARRDGTDSRNAEEPLGEIVGVVRVVACLPLEIAEAKYPEQAEFLSGPWCWIVEPVVARGLGPLKGRLGIFDVDVPELAQLFPA